MQVLPASQLGWSRELFQDCRLTTDWWISQVVILVALKNASLVWVIVWLGAAH